MHEGDSGESDSREGGRDKGQEMIEVDATGGKKKKETGKKGTEKAAGGKSATREMQNGGATLKQ